MPFLALGKLGERKAHTLRGSCKSWPVGAAVLKRLPYFRAVMLVEGGPDLLTALHFCLERGMHDTQAVANVSRTAAYTALQPDGRFHKHLLEVDGELLFQA